MCDAARSDEEFSELSIFFRHVVSLHDDLRRQDVGFVQQIPREENGTTSWIRKPRRLDDGELLQEVRDEISRPYFDHWKGVSGSKLGDKCYFYHYAVGMYPDTSKMINVTMITAITEQGAMVQLRLGTIDIE